MLSFSMDALVRRARDQEHVASNLANMNTPGFKATHPFFDALEEAVAGTSPRESTYGGSNRSYVDFGQGALRQTGQALDVALNGDGFFVVDSPEGETYTRAGNFRLNSEGEIVTAEGYHVMGEGGPIAIEGGEVVIDKTGLIQVDGEEIGQFKIAHFGDMTALRPVGSARFRNTGEQGPGTAENVEVNQGSLEDPNVQGKIELITMVHQMSLFESSQRALKMQNEALRRVANDLF